MVVVKGIMAFYYLLMGNRNVIYNHLAVPEYFSVTISVWND